MNSNFGFLKSIDEYKLFADACIEAEKVINYSPAMSAVGSRKALELAVKWIYSADKTMKIPYKNNLQSLVHEPTFRFAINPETWGKLQRIIKIGNNSVHSNMKIVRSSAVLSLHILFEFIQWLDYCYGKEYVERKFDEKLLDINPKEKNDDVNKLQQILDQKDNKIEALLKKIEKISEELTNNKEANKKERTFTPEDLSEFETRRKYIDEDLRQLGWEFKENIFTDCVEREVKVTGMPNDSGIGKIDYVLYGKDGKPLAIIEAKRTSKDPNKGKHQAFLYADCLEKMTGTRPIIFNTNGFETYLWDDKYSPQRKVSGIFSKEDLLKRYNQRYSKKPLDSINIDDNITDRYYQKEAVKRVCENIESGHQRSLLVMATGTGKTRTVASITDVLSRGGYITNVLFLADRRELVKQAKDGFKNYIPDMSLCNLLVNKDDKNARIVFSTYPTMLNSIDTAKAPNGEKIFTAAHFDLIIIDEAHRSIFKKYRAIFEYFDAYIIGLTATPKQDIYSNTFEFFEVENENPTFNYDLNTATNIDHVLVPFHNIEVSTKILKDGIVYDDLSPKDKERYEDDFTDEDGEMPNIIPAPDINKFIFNRNTVDYVINDLMTNGIRDKSGNRVGKTIIFAQNKDHAQYIVDRFNALYPDYVEQGQFCQRIVCDDDYAQDAIDKFKKPKQMPVIAVSVDMLDTGVDVPEIVNLVFFKKVYSKTKFWQMIGRGTRLCKNLLKNNEDKKEFYIFDYLGNFEFFRVNKDGKEAGGAQSTIASIFSKRIKLIYALQDSCYAYDEYENLRNVLIDGAVEQILNLNIERVDVKLKRRYVEKYKVRESFQCLSDGDKTDLIENISDLVTTSENDDKAIEFDNLMYGIMLSQIEGTKSFNNYKNKVISKCNILIHEKASLPQVKEKITILKQVSDDDYWKSSDILNFEKVRLELRNLMKFAIEDNFRKKQETIITDTVLRREIDKSIDEGYEYENYKVRVNRYIEENKNNIAIYKLRNNIPLTEKDYKMLENVFIGELGTKEDYEREFRDTPFGLLVRHVAKLEQEAANKAFSKFINEQSLTPDQIVFVKKIIDYICINGYIDSPKDLLKTPFDRPTKFIKLFDLEKQKEIARIIGEIKENAVKILS